MALFVLSTRSWIGPSLAAVALEVAAAGIVYLVTFVFFGIRAEERRFYFSKISEMTARWRPIPLSEGA
jgi:hypothetical protein